MENHEILSDTKKERNDRMYKGAGVDVLMVISHWSSGLKGGKEGRKKDHDSLCSLFGLPLGKMIKNTYNVGNRQTAGLTAVVLDVSSDAVALGASGRLAGQGARRGTLGAILGVTTVDGRGEAVVTERHCVKGHVELLGGHDGNRRG